MTEETKLIWKDWNEEDWINASYCDTCGLPLIMLEPEEGEECGQMACVYCTWEEDQTSVFEGKVAELQSTISTQLETIKRLKEDAMALAEDYCPSWEQNHAKTCPQSLLGKHYGREKEPCDCGYEVKYKRHNELMQELEVKE